jgi:two-component system sensor histidine kinase HydH
MGPTDVGQAIERALTVLKPEIEKTTVRITRKIPPDLRKIKADTSQMTQLFLNLFLNALQAMPEGGRLEITVYEKSRRGGKRVPSLLIEIRDTGHGIAPDTLEHLFMPFYTNREEGTGLGLAIAHKIVEDHDGTIDVRSTEGKGTTFTLTFPQTQE